MQGTYIPGTNCVPREHGVAAILLCLLLLLLLLLLSFGQDSQAEFQDMNLVPTKYESENRTLRPQCSVPNTVRDQIGTT
jgi:hypothetical protein